MKEIQLSDAEADYLITLLKRIFKKYELDLSPGNKGKVKLKAVQSDHEFYIDYYTSKFRNDKITLHLRESENNLSLVRVNIDEKSFHKNADGTKIKGNRLLLFSQREHFEKTQKGDYKTHVRAFELPEPLKETSSFEELFIAFLKYVNVKSEGLIQFKGLL